MSDAIKIRARGLAKRYETTRKGESVLAFNGVSLDVREGEFVALLGPSGCGKSTFLRCIAGLETPSEGELTLDGRPITGPGADRGMAFQAYALFPWKTLRQNIEFGPRVRGVSPAERAKLVRRYVDLVGLTGFEDKYPHELSGGMQQRGALARLFANDSDVMLLDEPLAALDAQTRELLQEELVRLWSAEKKTMIMVTHAVEEAVFCSDRIVVMSRRPGRVKAIIDVNLPRPRTNETRLTEDFFQLLAQVRRLVREEVEPIATGGRA
jgi:NitT/TauT family transport system ATP-binding protein